MEQLLLFILFVLAWLVSAVLRRVQRRGGAPAPRPVPPPAPERVPPRPPRRPHELPPGARVAVLADDHPPPALRRPSPIQDRPRRPVPRGLGGPADLRRAIVLATILGPCRALERERVSSPGDITPP